MAWYPKLVFYFGLFDAGMLMLGGLIIASCILVGWDTSKVFDRVGPALGTIIGSNIAAALVLGATRWLMG